MASWTGPAEAKVSWTGPTLGGALEALTLVGARVALTLVGTQAALTLVGALSALTHSHLVYRCTIFVMLQDGPPL